MAGRHWRRGEDANDAWESEPESLYASTAPFCEGAIGLTQTDGVSLALLSASPNARELVFISDETARRIDDTQFALGVGPCLSSFKSGRPTCVTDAPNEARWSLFCREIAEIGVNAVFSFPVSIGSHPIGVLELYRRTAGALTNDEYDAALGTAAAIGAVIASTYQRWSDRANVDEVDGAALVALTEGDPFSRSGVREAARILAAHRGVSVTDALVRIRAYAFARDLRVTTVAAQIVELQIPMDSWGDDARGE